MFQLKSMFLRLAALGLLLVSGYTQAADIGDARHTDTQEGPPRVVMARVGDLEITVKDFMEFLARNTRFLEISKTPAGKGQALRALIEEEILYREMLRKGLMKPGVTARERSLAMAKLTATEFNPPKPQEEVVRNFYEENKAKFDMPKHVRLSQIFLAFPEGATADDRAKIRGKAENALQRLKNGESFAGIADELSENPIGKGRGGDVGLVWMDEWLEKNLIGLEVGQYTGIIESPEDRGLDILMLTEVHEAETPTFEEVRARIETSLRETESEKMRQAYIRSLLSQMQIELVLDDLKQAYPNGLFE